MRKIAFCPVLLTVLTAGFCTVKIDPSHAGTPLANTSVPTAENQIAQWFYTPPSTQNTVMVVGRGRAAQAPDTARLEFKFGDSSSYYESSPEGIPDASNIGGITKESLQPVVDALVSAGVPQESIEIQIPRFSSPASPYSFPFPSTDSSVKAKIVVNLTQPNRDRLEELFTVVGEATQQVGTSLTDVGVMYSVGDCTALQQVAYQEAVNDAKNRATAIASAMGAELEEVASTAEPFYSAFLPACNSKEIIYPFGIGGVTSYDPYRPVEVEIYKEIFFTYTVK